MFLWNAFALEADEVYKYSKYDGGLSKGGKWTFLFVQYIASVRDIWLLLWSFSCNQNLIP